MEVASESLVGHVLGGRYRILRPIGAGGMGTVFEAEQLDLRRRVALKVLTDMTPLAMERLRQEAMTAGSLQSQHVVTIHEFCANPGEPPFLVMELLLGESLSALLGREQKLDPGRAVRIAVQILAGLEAAHQVGIVHRDIKPSNVWLTQSGFGEEHVKVLDFGIAKNHDEPGGVKTATGQVLGTPAYLAPEQLRGQRATVRSDVHAVGIVLYEMITGARPWQATDSILVEVLERIPAPLTSLVTSTPPALSDTVARALSKDPNGRFSSAAEMARTLLAAFPPSRPSLIAASDEHPAAQKSALALPASTPTNTFDVVGSSSSRIRVPSPHVPTPRAATPARPPSRPLPSTSPWPLALGVLALTVMVAFVGCVALVGIGAAARPHRPSSKDASAAPTSEPSPNVHPSAAHTGRPVPVVTPIAPPSSPPKPLASAF